MVNTINAEQFGEICDAVWNDRDGLLRDRGRLSGDAALVRAVFWRLCKAGVKSTSSAEYHDAEPTILAYQSVVSRMLQVNARPPFDGAQILKELVERFHKANI